MTTLATTVWRMEAWFLEKLCWADILLGIQFSGGDDAFSFVFLFCFFKKVEIQFTVKCTDLKCLVQWVHECILISKSRYRTFPSLYKDSQYPQLKGNQNLSTQIILPISQLHINGSIQYVLFGVFTQHNVSEIELCYCCIKHSLLFVAWKYAQIIPAHSFIFWWAFGLFLVCWSFGHFLHKSF